MFKTKSDKKTNADLRKYIISGINEAELSDKLPGTFKGLATLIQRRFEHDCWSDCKIAAMRGQGPRAVFAAWIKTNPSLFIEGFSDSFAEAADRLLDNPQWFTEDDRISRLITHIYNEIEKGAQS